MHYTQHTCTLHVTSNMAARTSVLSPSPSRSPASVSLLVRNVERLAGRCDDILSGSARFGGQEWKIVKVVTCDSLTVYHLILLASLFFSVCAVASRESERAGRWFC